MVRTRSVSWGGNSSTTIREIDERFERNHLRQIAHQGAVDRLQLSQDARRRGRPLSCGRSDMESSQLHPSDLRMSRAAAPNSRYLSEQAHSDANAEVQTRQTLARIDDLLQSAGTPRSQLLPQPPQAPAQQRTPARQQPTNEACRLPSTPREIGSHALAEMLSQRLIQAGTWAGTSAGSPFSSPGSTASSTPLSASEMSLSSIGSSNGSSLQSSPSASPAGQSPVGAEPDFVLSSRLLLESPAIPLRPTASTARNIPPPPPRLLGVARTQPEYYQHDLASETLQSGAEDYLRARLNGGTGRVPVGRGSETSTTRLVEGAQGWNKSPPSAPWRSAPSHPAAWGRRTEFGAMEASNSPPNLNSPPNFNFATPSYPTSMMDEATLFDQRWKPSGRY